MDLSAIALQGLQQAETQLGNVATKLAGAGASPAGANLDIVDLSTEMVALMSAKTNVSVNLSVLKTINQIQKRRNRSDGLNHSGGVWFSDTTGGAGRPRPCVAR